MDRRGFLKAGSKVIPALAVLGFALTVPLPARASCGDTCFSSCEGDCKGSCRILCLNSCVAHCMNDCGGTCRGTCSSISGGGGGVRG
jgi:CXXX repeat radical SAM target protein